MAQDGSPLPPSTVTSGSYEAKQLRSFEISDFENHREENDFSQAGELSYVERALFQQFQTTALWNLELSHFQS